MTYPASGKAERFPGMVPSFYVAVDRFGAPLTPEQPAGKINVTDPDSRTLKTARGSFRATTPGGLRIIALTAWRTFGFSHRSTNRHEDRGGRVGRGQP